MIKESYQEVPTPEDLTQQVDRMEKGELPKETKPREGKNWELIARESLTNLKGEIDSILSLKLPKKTRADELKMIYQRLVEKRKHVRDSDRLFERPKKDGTSAYLEEKIEAIEKEMGK